MDAGRHGLSTTVRGAVAGGCLASLIGLGLLLRACNEAMVLPYPPEARDFSDADPAVRGSTLARVAHDGDWVRTHRDRLERMAAEDDSPSVRTQANAILNEHIIGRREGLAAWPPLQRSSR